VRSPTSRSYASAVCGRCLKGDVKPVPAAIVVNWMLAVCPHHGTVLIQRCKACGAGLRVAPFAITSRFSPATCTRCGRSLLEQGRDLSAPIGQGDTDGTVAR